MTKSKLTPQDVINVLNQSYQVTRESSRRDTIDAAQKALNNCLKWLKEQRISYYQTTKGKWVLGKEKLHE